MKIRQMITPALLAGCIMITGSSAFPVNGYTAQASQTANVDVTSRLQLLGQPFNNEPYARNVWDMQVFDGKIYLGHGNSSNSKPSPNAGPVPIIYYDPQTGKFVTQKVVVNNAKTGKQETREVTDDEQIDTFKIFRNKLYIPGNDSVIPGWAYGNYYELNGDHWNEYQNLPGGIHVYDMAYYQGNLFAAIGTEDAPVVLISGDDGKTWKEFAKIDGLGSRTYKFFQFKGMLYASAIIIPDNKTWDDETNLLAIDKNLNIHQQKVTGKTLLPGMSFVAKAGSSPYKKISKTVVLNNQLVYIAGELYNDSQIMPESLIAAKNINKARAIQLPDPNARPTDMIVRGKMLYLLTYTKQSDGSYISRVYKTRNLNKWTEVLKFKQDTYAKSLEEYQGDFYFGLGTDTDPISESAGKILRIKAADLPQ
ncbi:hypothetical protein [Paenibacillus shenyangensis]|uniref:hypothetical protein n=1 Tax=Paenibacillus sp. A9 TaxID=1284352 RepID=UPI00036C6CD7|nr:hypothetical protein [Paenibacillus sp. A9]